MHLYAYVDGDIVDRLQSGPIVPVGAVEVPEALAGLNISRLRYVSGQIVDASPMTLFWIDPAGRKHVEPREGWQQIACEFNAALILDAGTWRPRTSADDLAPRVKAECSRRIVAVLGSPAAQINLNAYAAELLARRIVDGEELTETEAGELATARDARTWVADMQAACRSLIAAGASEFSSDAHWPAAPGGAAELAERF